MRIGRLLIQFQRPVWFGWITATFACPRCGRRFINLHGTDEGRCPDCQISTKMRSR